jgi:hypothetical protein
VVRSGLFDGLAANFAAEMYPVGTNRVLITSSFANAPITGVRCAP